MQSITRSFAKKIILGQAARDGILSGVNQLADAVQTTLGPKGRTVLIQQTFGSAKITKDGVTVAKSIELEDSLENLGAQLIKDVAAKTNDVAGDGTTTSTVLARAIYSEGVKAVASGLNPIGIKHGVDAAVEEAVKYLESNTKSISSADQIKQVATISANNDTEVGELIAAAVLAVGKDGVITINEGRTLEDSLDMVEGMQIDRGWLSAYFVTETATQTAELDSPYVLVTDSSITSAQSLLGVLEPVAREGRPLLIVAEDVQGEALATLVVNSVRSSLRVCAIKAPGYGDARKAMLQDIAVATGATLVSADLGMRLEACGPEVLGAAEKATVSKEDTVLLKGAGTPEAVADRVSTLHAQLKQDGLTSYQKAKLNERIGKMAGGVAVITVGGASEVEVGEKKDRYNDALCATRAAVAEGVLPGGGVALLRAAGALTESREASLHTSVDQQDMEERVGYEIVERALRAPARAIADNAGEEGVLVAGRISDTPAFSYGYDARRGVYGDMYEAGVVDPLRVVRASLVDAASVASLMSLSEVAIVEIDDSLPMPPPSMQY
eukprot:gnl/Dysnectes_brevis/863_a956_2044.p1 GENE.gnl/Dysnectes_brevis/863_a956_2044~~gnl/Dysnectes_brevis/863_a956_2044.p1  ORF type:complete len:555 (+),score=228.27 gnl/Dysnectes_brevis/863_a956_2044:78-1742(+)